MHRDVLDLTHINDNNSMMTVHLSLYRLQITFAPLHKAYYQRRKRECRLHGRGAPASHHQLPKIEYSLFFMDTHPLIFYAPL